MVKRTPAHPTQQQRGLQKTISSHLDACLRATLRQTLQASGDWPGDTRIAELSAESVDHGWLWHLSKHHGPILGSSEYLHAVRVRLGAAGAAEPVPCAICGKPMDTAGCHPSCCAPAEATRGHYAVSKLVHTAALACDPSVETEVPGLIPCVKIPLCTVRHTIAHGSGFGQGRANHSHFIFIKPAIFIMGIWMASPVPSRR